MYQGPSKQGPKIINLCGGYLADIQLISTIRLTNSRVWMIVFLLYNVLWSYILQLYCWLDFWFEVTSTTDNYFVPFGLAIMTVFPHSSEHLLHP